VPKTTMFLGSGVSDAHMDWQRWRLFWNQGKDGYNEDDKYDSSRIWTEKRSDLKRWDVHKSWSQG